MESDLHIIIRPDDHGWDRLPEAINFVHQYREKIFPKGKPGRNNSFLHVMQHSGFSWSFEVWHTEEAFNVEIRSKPYNMLQREREETP